MPAPKKDETDHKIERLQHVNHKLMNKMKELNLVLENTLDRANTRKMAKMNKEANVVKQDVNHQIKVKQTEIANTGNSIEKYKGDIADMKRKLGNAQGVNKLMALEEKLRTSKQEKADLEKKIKDLQIKHKEQGRALEKLSNEDEFQLKLRSLVDELRVWKDKVRKLQEQQQKEERNKKSQ